MPTFLVLGDPLVRVCGDPATVKPKTPGSRRFVTPPNGWRARADWTSSISSIRREPVGWVLRVILDRPTRLDAEGRVVVEPLDHSVGIEDCQRVSHDLSAILDVEDPLDRAYTLEVSSPGLERALRGRSDYERFSGRMAKVVVREAVNGQMHFEGRLRGVEDDALVLEGTGNG